MTVTYEFTERICFESSGDQTIFHGALKKLLGNPASVNMSEQDFSPEEWGFLPFLIDITHKSSFFELDNQDHVDCLVGIIEKVNCRRKKSGFIKCDFSKEQLRVFRELYEPLPKE